MQIVDVVDPAVLRAHAGAEFLRMIKDGELPLAPIFETLDFHLAEVEVGRVVFAGRPQRRHYNPIGTVHGGWAATLLDSCMACAVHSTLPAGQGYTTLEIKVHYTRAVRDDMGLLRAEGRIIHSGRQIGTSEGRLVDDKGRVYAHGTTTCLVFPL